MSFKALQCLEPQNGSLQSLNVHKNEKLEDAKLSFIINLSGK